MGRGEVGGGFDVEGGCDREVSLTQRSSGLAIA